MQPDQAAPCVLICGERKSRGILSYRKDDICPLVFISNSPSVVRDGWIEAIFARLANDAGGAACRSINPFLVC